MNPLNAYPRARKVAYLVQFVVAGLVLLVGIGYGAAEVALPTWYAVVAAVTSAAWSYLGLTAAQNTDAPAVGERGAVSPVVALLAVIAVVLLLMLLGVGVEIH